jgi:hypothetical protein
MAKLKHLIAALAAPLAVLAVPAAAQTQLENPQSAWVHTATGISFPLAQGDFSRTQITQFDEEGRNVGVIYQLVRGGQPIAITGIYIYPARASCEIAWNDVRKEATSNGGQLRDATRAPSPNGKTPNAAYRGQMELRSGENAMPVVAYLYCSPDGKWLIKYFAYINGPADLEGETIKLMRSIKWPQAMVQ